MNDRFKLGGGIRLEVDSNHAYGEGSIPGSQQRTTSSHPTETTANSPRHNSLRKIHGVCDRQNDQFGIHQRRPVEKVVNDILFRGHELVKFIHQNHTKRRTSVRVTY